MASLPHCISLVPSCPASIVASPTPSLEPFVARARALARDIGGSLADARRRGASLEAAAEKALVAAASSALLNEPRIQFCALVDRRRNVLTATNCAAAGAVNEAHRVGAIRERARTGEFVLLGTSQTQVIEVRIGTDGSTVNWPFDAVWLGCADEPVAHRKPHLSVIQNR